MKEKLKIRAIFITKRNSDLSDFFHKTKISQKISLLNYLNLYISNIHMILNSIVLVIIRYNIKNANDLSYLNHCFFKIGQSNQLIN